MRLNKQTYKQFYSVYLRFFQVLIWFNTAISTSFFGFFAGSHSHDSGHGILLIGRTTLANNDLRADVRLVDPDGL